ncbi:MAG TPA: heparinase II/III family protein [Planctomycetota bacterium]|nr:heparinase II/III family protein [Planctomycetota bacterium]
MSAVLLAVAAGCLRRPEGSAASGRFPPTRLETCRPRLFFRPDTWSGGVSLAELRGRAAADPFKDRVRSLRTTRANLALKWLVAGDEDAAAEARKALLAFDPKLATSDEGTELLDVALAYDWLHEWKGFAPEDRKLVGDRMLALAETMKAELLGPGAHIFHTRMYAWASGVGVAGLALHGDRPEGAGLFEFARRYYQERLLPARRIQGGAMHNGLSYGPNYMMFPLLQFLEAAKSAANVDYFHTAAAEDSAWLQEVAPFLIHCIRPDGRHVQYADVATEDPAKHFRFMLDILAREYRDGYAAEAARRISERFKTSGYHAEWLHLFFAFHDPTVQPRPLDELPLCRAFSPKGVGHVFMRSDWSESGTMVHFRCGDYFENHGHFDQGGFTLFRKGALALKTSGYWGFDTPYRHHYYKQAISTNTLIFSDPADAKDEGRQRNMHYQSAGTVEAYLAHKAPGAEPRVETGDIIHAGASLPSSSAKLCTAAADVTAAWDPAKVKCHVRQLALVGDKHLVVVDETETARPETRARWLLHAQVEPMALAGADAGVWKVALKDSVLFIRPLEPAKPKVTLIGGEGHECEVNGVNYPYTGTDKYVKAHKGQQDLKPQPAYGLWRMEIEHPEPAARRVFVTVLTADDPGARPPAASVEVSDKELTVIVGGRVLGFKRLAGIQ